MTAELKTTRWIRRPSAAVAAEAALASTVATKPLMAWAIESFRGGTIRFYSNGADGDTATFGLYSIVDDGVGGFTCASLGDVTMTLSTIVAVPGTIADDPNLQGIKRWADECGWTASTYGTAMLTRVGGNIAAYQGTANTHIAELMVSDFGGATHIALVCTTHGPTDALGIVPILKLEV